MKYSYMHNIILIMDSKMCAIAKCMNSSQESHVDLKYIADPTYSTNLSTIMHGRGVSQNLHTPVFPCW